MPKFSNKSNLQLDTCHPLLQELFRAVVKKHDCAVIEGHRNRRRQNQKYQQGKSEVKWPDGKHNIMPSEAVDVGPWLPGRGIPWKDCYYFYDFACVVLQTAAEMGICIKWGGDWDGDGDIADQSFDDLGHFELLSIERCACGS